MDKLSQDSAHRPQLLKWKESRRGVRTEIPLLQYQSYRLAFGRVSVFLITAVEQVKKHVAVWVKVEVAVLGSPPVSHSPCGRSSLWTELKQHELQQRRPLRPKHVQFEAIKCAA